MHKRQQPKVLFICKERQYGSSYGLINSCKFIVNYLNDINIEAKVISVIDNNCIDREVTNYKPTHVFIEALWVVPDKFKILTKLHPEVKWIVRLHSKAPFLSTEGTATEWIKGYINLGIEVSVNNKEFHEDLLQVISDKITYLPNIYIPKYKQKFIYNTPCKEINIGCFGAHRIQKNQYEQAIAAIIFAKKIGKKLNFHMNYSNVEKDESILNNIKALFKDTKNDLVLHKWMNHGEFLDFLKTMDLGMQVSFTESFNIVTADFVYSNVPIVVSKDITWMPSWTRVDPTDTNNIVDTLELVWKYSSYGLEIFNKLALNKYNKQAQDVWVKYLK